MSVNSLKMNSKPVNYLFKLHFDDQIRVPLLGIIFTYEYMLIDLSSQCWQKDKQAIQIQFVLKCHSVVSLWDFSSIFYFSLFIFSSIVSCGIFFISPSAVICCMQYAFSINVNRNWKQNHDQDITNMVTGFANICFVYFLQHSTYIRFQDS